jgi:hypothetical protein
MSMNINENGARKIYMAETDKEAAVPAMDPEAGVLKKLSLAGLAKLSRLRYG